ncbi:leucine-rich repeat-containing protein 15-like [Actinia tenebrosa]|uniref:Leucine-rich repeat-containing protein 15-like n=1 Tax=Actinia tenebrosa TaxID=6105 RepID=A0A6P8IIT2_ACTTE|nr:leucine-rich repeat-containing protein 15-like [Actinia tenebrosa]
MNTSTYILVVFYLLLNCYTFVEPKRPTLTNSTHHCPRPNVGTCSCEWTGEYCRVTCAGLDSLPKNLPPKLVEVYIHKGTISEVPEDFFTPFELLQVLMIQHNKVSNKFRLPKNTWNVDLTGNMMKPSDLHGMFDGLKKIHQITLSENQLQDNLLPGTFQDISKLNSLIIESSHMTDIKEGTFVGLSNLVKLELVRNNIHTLRKGTFKGIKTSKDNAMELYLKSNNLHVIEDGTFKDCLEIKRLELSFNNLTKLPDLHGLSKYVEKLDFTNNRITDFSSLNKYGIISIMELLFGNNDISEIPSYIFKNITIGRLLDLTDNHIKHVPGRFLQNSPDVVEILLHNNEIESIDEDSFEGLSNLQGLYLFNNKIKQLPNGVFKNLPLTKL